MIVSYACALFAVFCTAAAQLLLKRGAVVSLGGHWAALWANRATLTGYVLMFVATIANTKAYHLLPLKLTVAMTALSVLLVTLGSKVFFKERLQGRALLGMLLVFAGVVIFGL